MIYKYLSGVNSQVGFKEEEEQKHSWSRKKRGGVRNGVAWPVTVGTPTLGIMLEEAGWARGRALEGCPGELEGTLVRASS